MSPQQLLIGTEQAIGSAMLMDNHEQLKSLQKQLVSIEDKIKSTDVHLTKEVQLNERLESELVRLNDYKAVRCEGYPKGNKKKKKKQNPMHFLVLVEMN